MSDTALKTRAHIGRVAEHGEKMIEVSIRFWTNNIAKKKGEINPKHAWTQGVVRMTTNDAHMIESMTPIPFNSIAEIGPAIEQLMIDHGIKLHIGDKSRKYMVGPPPG